MFSIQAYEHHDQPGHVGAADFVNKRMDDLITKVGAMTDTSDKMPGASGSPAIGLIAGAVGGIGGGYVLATYVFKKSNFWATFFGYGIGETIAISLGGDFGSAFIPSILGAYGASRYVHGG